LGLGKFALPFGDFDVNITVPADHVMEATGELMNRSEVFTQAQVKDTMHKKRLTNVLHGEAEAEKRLFY
jgi:hypothetical protein